MATERLFPDPAMGFWGQWRYSLFKFLRRNSDTSDHYFGLGREVPLALQVFPLKIG